MSAERGTRNAEQTVELTLLHAARTHAVLDEVAAERAKTEAIRAQCEEPPLNVEALALLLGEAHGGLCTLLLECARASAAAQPIYREGLREQAIKAAAVAIAIAESLTEAQP